MSVVTALIIYFTFAGLLYALIKVIQRESKKIGKNKKEPTLPK